MTSFSILFVSWNYSLPSLQILTQGWKITNPWKNRGLSFLAHQPVQIPPITGIISYISSSMDCKGFTFPSPSNLGVSEPVRLAQDTVRHGKGCFYLLNGGGKANREEIRGMQPLSLARRVFPAACGHQRVPLSICSAVVPCEMTAMCNLLQHHWFPSIN